MSKDKKLLIRTIAPEKFNSSYIKKNSKVLFVYDNKVNVPLCREIYHKKVRDPCSPLLEVEPYFLSKVSRQVTLIFMK